MTSDHPEIPRLPAFLVNDGCQRRCWCEHCKCWHYHSPNFGHRAEHCHSVDRRGRLLPPSPYRRTGYYLCDPAELAGES